MSNTSVLLYVPNLLCYARILLAIYGLFILQTKQQQPVEVENQSFTESHRSYLIAVSSAIFTDLLDGYFARLLSQCSTLGIFLDVVADNILRTTLWMGAIVVEPEVLSARHNGNLLGVEYVRVYSTDCSSKKDGSLETQRHPPSLDYTEVF